MCHWKKWVWPGILTVAILAGLALWMKAGAIESDLEAKATAALTDQGQSWASVEMDGRDATIQGFAPGETEQASAVQLASGAYDVRLVKDGTSLLAAQSPYVFTASRAGSAVELTGFVPDEETRAKVVEAAKTALPDAELNDNTTLARGAPDSFLDAAGFGFAQLGGLSKGKITLQDATLSVEGVAATFDTFGAVNVALDGALPGGFSLATKKITPPAVSPYQWAADFSGDAVTLSGFVPDQAAREAIGGQVKAALGDLEIRDGMQIAAGEPKDFLSGTEFVIRQLPRFSSGAVSLSDTAFSVSGVAKSSEDYSAAKATVGGDLPAGLMLASEKILPAEVSPYTWKANHDGKQVILSGFVPDGGVRAVITDVAKAVLPDAEIEDKMRVAAGAPAGFDSAAGFALEQLPRFSNGSVSLSDLALSVEGVAKDPASYETVRSAIADELPSSLVLFSENITPPSVAPYKWSADYDGSTVTLTGLAPNSEALNGVEAETKRVLPTAAIRNEMQIADGAPESYSSATSQALGLLPNFTAGKVALSDLDLTVEGKASTSQAYLRSTAMTKKLGDGLKLAVARIEPPAVKGDYKWNAEKSGQSIILSGNVPSADDRASIAAAAKQRYPNARIVNRMVVATGAPNGFMDQATKALSRLEGIEQGHVAIVNTTTDIEGQAASIDGYEKTLADIGSGPGEGFQYGTVNVKPAVASPYIWSLMKDAGKSVLTGFVPSEAARKRIVGMAEETLKAPVEDRLKIAAGEPDGFDAAIKASMDGISAIKSGRADLEDNKLSIQGEAESEENATSIGSAYKNESPQNFEVTSRLSFPPPEQEPEAKPEPEPEKPQAKLKVDEPVKTPAPAKNACDIDFRSLFRGEKILFTTDKAVVRQESYPLLNRIAAAKKKCPNAKFQIAGHTDSRGRDDYNLRLSQARAEAVVEYLKKSGVTAGMEPKGYGETRPVSSNRTGRGMARNRRIEFRVLNQ